MPFESKWVDPEVFLTHNGVTVYHTYKCDDFGYGASTYVFTTDKLAKEDTDDYAFDVRDYDSKGLLKRYPAKTEEIKQTIIAAIDDGRIKAPEKTEDEKSVRPLFKTTIVIWSEDDPSQIALTDLAREADTGNAYCSQSKTYLVEEPELDIDWDGTEFFGE